MAMSIAERAAGESALLSQRISGALDEAGYTTALAALLAEYDDVGTLSQKVGDLIDIKNEIVSAAQAMGLAGAVNLVSELPAAADGTTYLVGPQSGGVRHIYFKSPGGWVDLGAFTGAKGWAPIIAPVTDGARVVNKVVDWSGGEGTKPAANVYLGAAGLVATAAEAVDVAGVMGSALTPYVTLATAAKDAAVVAKDASVAAKTGAESAQSGAAGSAVAAAAAYSGFGGTMKTYAGTDEVQPLCTDRDGRVILGFYKTTGYLYANLDMVSLVSPLLLPAIVNYVAMNARGLTVYTGTDILPIAADRNNNTLVGIDPATGFMVGHSVGQFAIARPNIALLAADRPVLAAWNGVIVYGQSLSIGAFSTPVLSSSQYYSNITFGSGPRSAKVGNTAGATTNLSPGTTTTKALVEDLVGAYAESGLGETPCSGLANEAVERAGRESGLAAASFVIFASAPGRGGEPIASLSKGQPDYNNFIDHVTQAKARAVAASKSYALHAVCWVQGESDVTNGTTRATYKAALLQLQSDIDTDVRAITGQSAPVHLLVYQPTHGIRTTPDTTDQVVRAFQDAVNASTRIHFVTPIWDLPRVGDLLHLTNVGSHLLGRRFGRAYKQLVVDGIKPEAIWPLAASAKTTTLTIALRVPHGPLVIDNALLPAATDYGFKVVDDTGTLTISNIKVVEATKVQITLNRALGANPKVRYALDYAGAGLSSIGSASGNLRDSTPDKTVISGVTYPLWHLAPHFELPILILDPNT